MMEQKKKKENDLNVRPLIPGPTRIIDPQDQAAKKKEIAIQMITRDEYAKSQ